MSDNDNVSMERNFAREVGLFNPPKEVKSAATPENNIRKPFSGNRNLSFTNALYLEVINKI